MIYVVFVQPSKELKVRAELERKVLKHTFRGVSCLSTSRGYGRRS